LEMANRQRIKNNEREISSMNMNIYLEG